MHESVPEDSFRSHSLDLQSGGSPLLPQVADDEFRPARSTLQELASPVAASNERLDLPASNERLVLPASNERLVLPASNPTDVDLQRLEEIDRRLAELTARRASTGDDRVLE